MEWARAGAYEWRSRKGACNYRIHRVPSKSKLLVNELPNKETTLQIKCHSDDIKPTRGGTLEQGYRYSSTWLACSIPFILSHRSGLWSKSHACITAYPTSTAPLWTPWPLSPCKTSSMQVDANNMCYYLEAIPFCCFILQVRWVKLFSKQINGCGLINRWHY